jgi:acyl-CoA synthetase (AMP-forming)/AMP-acid ligase II
MIEGWGMSETCAIGTNNPVTNSSSPAPSACRCRASTSPSRTMRQRPAPGRGGRDLHPRPQRHAGYYNQPEETAKAFTADGFMRTGDIGVMDERGYTRIIDRKKDMILVSGFNVFPNELENVISLCPGVLECAAVGCLTNSRAKPSRCSWCAATLADRRPVIRYCHEHLTGYKCPRFIEFRDELPKTNVGKILRRELRSPAAPAPH